MLAAPGAVRPEPANRWLFEGNDNDIARHASVLEAGNRAVDAFNNASPCPFVKEQRDDISKKAIASVETVGTLSQRVMRTAEGRDKVMKFAQGILEVLNYWLKDNPNVSEGTRDGFHKFETMAVKPARTVLALMNIFAGVLTSIKNTTIVLVRLLEGLVKGAQLDGGATRKISIFHTTTGKVETYKTRTEYFIGFFAMIGQLGGSLAYAIGFGICAPIKCVDAYWKNAMSDSTREVGNTFSFIMMLNHITVFFGNIWDLVFATKKYMESAAGDMVAVRDFYTRLTLTISSMLEKVAEFGCDLVTVFKVDTHPVVKPVCTLVYSGISLWRAVHKCEIDMEAQIRAKAEEARAKQITENLVGSGVRLHDYVLVHGSAPARAA